MANHGPILNQHDIQQHQNDDLLCKVCNTKFDTPNSYEVHVSYHHENLMKEWGTPASNNQQKSTSGQKSSHIGDEANNNTTKNSTGIKREFNIHLNTIPASADSSDANNMKTANRSPDSFTNRTTPETSISFGHPPTPQSYNSAPSPYQNAETNNFSPSFHNFQPIKSERLSPLSHYSNFPAASPFHDNQYFSMDPPHSQQQQQQQQQLSYQQDYHLNKAANQSNNFRYQPYHNSPHFDRSSVNSQVSSSSRSPSYGPQNAQPTPSPSPKQCDKCGRVCESATHLIEHLQLSHPPTAFAQQQAQHQLQQQQQQQQQQSHFPFSTTGSNESDIKKEEPQAEILDLDSHKVHVYQTPEEQEEALKRQNAELAALNGGHGAHNPHSVSAMLSWPNSVPHQKIFPQNGVEQRMYQNATMPNNMHDEKLFQNSNEQKLFQPHQMHNAEFVTNNVSTTTHESNSQSIGVPNMVSQPQPYRPFDHIPPQPNPPVISSTQVPNPVPPSNIPPPITKGANWKSNEARRPKTYNCSACNKWFTSSGHLKRHYNTTLHKNAVKSSGQPDPATLPISTHHHPNRDPNHQPHQTSRQQEANSVSPSPMVSSEEARSDDSGMAPPYDRAQHPGLIQQPPSGPYDRHPPNLIGSQPPPNLHSPIPQNPSLNNSLTNLSSGSPPNGEAGPSANNLELSRGLLSTSTPNTLHHQTTTQLSQMTNMSAVTNQLPPFSLLNQQPHHMMGIHSSTATNHQGFNPVAPQPISANYPNELSPHVIPTMLDTNSQQQALTSQIITGESIDDHDASSLESAQPLPSFAQLNSILLPSYAPVMYSNVGGLGPVTDSVIQYYMSVEDHQNSVINFQNDEQLVSSEHDPNSFSPPPTIIFRNRLSDSSDFHHLQPLDTSQPDQNESYSVDQPMYSPNYENNNVQVITQTTTALPPLVIKEEIINPKNGYEQETVITSSVSPGAKKPTAPTAAKHKCVHCDKFFNKACYMTQHNKTFHSGEKPFKCNKCGKRFSDKKIYEEHESKHAGDKPYKCEQCPKQFNHKTDLRRHMCLHTGIKPFACEQCGKGFIRKDHMLKHCETHVRKNAQRQAQQQQQQQQQIQQQVNNNSMVSSSSSRPSQIQTIQQMGSNQGRVLQEQTIVGIP